MRHTLVGWAYRGQLEMHPHAPSLGIHGGATGAESPAGVEVTNAITRIGAARFDSAGEHPALSRGVATNRRGPRSRKRSWTRPQQGVLASDTCRVFGTTPCNNDSPGWGIFVPQRSFRLRLRRSMDRLLPVSLRPLELSAVPRVDVVSSLAQELKRGPDPRLWRQAVSRRKTPALTGVR